MDGLSLLRTESNFKAFSSICSEHGFIGKKLSNWSAALDIWVLLVTVWTQVPFLWVNFLPTQGLK